MIENYIDFKFAHVLIAIISLGTGAALGLLLTFFAREPAQRAFVLRTVRTLLYWIVIPGYLLMLVTGMWTAHLGALLDAHWAEAAMHLWGLGAIFIAVTTVAVHRQIGLLATEDPSSRAYSRAYHRSALLGRVSAIGASLVTVVIIYLMVFKP
jgi:uncharacterized membrane protein